MSIPCVSAFRTENLSWHYYPVNKLNSYKLGNIKESIHAYKRALNINPDYDLAWFNLGGLYWNNGEKNLARDTWKQAIAKFPDHELVAEVKKWLE